MLWYVCIMIYSASTPPMEPKRARSLVDQAIANVASEEYERLSKNYTAHDAPDRVGETVISFDSLQRGTMPNYGRWQSLMHLTWYQPHHINLAYTLLTELAETLRDSRVTNSNGPILRLVDLGCGNLAMHIALKLAIATGIIQCDSGAAVDSVGIDPSSDMIRLGRRLSDELDQLAPIPANPHLSFSDFHDAPAFQRATSRTGDVRITTVVSAMHAFYPSNVIDIKRQLAVLRDHTNPSTAVVTAHPNAFTTVDRAITPYPRKFNTEEYFFTKTSDLSWKGKLSHTTAFRSKLADLIEQQRTESFADWLSDSSYEMRRAVGYSDIDPEDWDGDVHSLIDHLGDEDKEYIRQTDKSIGYLRNPVRWSGPDVKARIYQRN